MFKDALLKCVKFYQHAFEYNQRVEKPILNSTGMKDSWVHMGPKEKDLDKGLTEWSRKLDKMKKRVNTKTKTKTKQEICIGSSKSG